MALKTKSWTFYNEANLDERIIIQDVRSHEALSRILSTLGEDWIVDENVMNALAEGAKAKNTAAPAPAPAARKEKPLEIEEPVLDHSRAYAPELPDEEFADEVKVAAKETPKEKNQEIAREAQKKSPPPLPSAPEKDFKQVRAEDRREQQRFDAEFRVILMAGSNTFRTISKDVSLGGMKLKTKVPQTFFSDKCVAYISNMNSGENIEMTCKVISDPKDPCRVQFAPTGAAQLKRLNDWLVQNEITKKKTA